MRIRCLVILLSLGLLTLAQSQQPNTSLQREVKVKIEATELDRLTLVKKLASHGADHAMKFQETESDFDYRIVFSTDQEKSHGTVWGSGGSFNTSGASADVFDAKGTELFRFERKQRGTDTGATNAVAKEIVKRLLKLNELSKPL